MKLLFFAILILAFPMASLAQAKKLDPGKRASLDGWSYTLTTTPARFLTMQQKYRPAAYEEWTKKLTGITNGMPIDSGVQLLKPARVHASGDIRNGHSVYTVVLDDAYYAGMMVTVDTMRIIWVTPPLAISWFTNTAKNESR